MTLPHTVVSFQQAKHDYPGAYMYQPQVYFLLSARKKIQSIAQKTNKLKDMAIEAEPVKYYEKKRWWW